MQKSISPCTVLLIFAPQVYANLHLRCTPEMLLAYLRREVYTDCTLELGPKISSVEFALLAAWQRGCSLSSSLWCTGAVKCKFRRTVLLIFAPYSTPEELLAYLWLEFYMEYTFATCRGVAGAWGGGGLECFHFALHHCCLSYHDYHHSCYTVLFSR